MLQEEKGVFMAHAGGYDEYEFVTDLCWLRQKPLRLKISRRVDNDGKEDMITL